MRELEIREALRRQLRARFFNDPDTQIIEELGLCQGTARIDIAVANCALHGYEIKSAADTLQRLGAQEQIYSRTFDAVTIVTARDHLEPILRIVPSWWGIVQARGTGVAIKLEVIRQGQENPGVDPYALAQLLWRDEALGVLEAMGRANGVRSKPREHIWRRLVESTTVEEIGRIVRTHLKSRQGWKAPEPQMSGGDYSLPFAT